MGFLAKYFECFALFLLFHIVFTQTSVDPTQCLNQAGTAFLPSATSCDNEREDLECEGIFRAPIEPSPAKVDINCVNPIMEVVALQCAKRCALCCETAEYYCGDDETAPINCTANRNKCRDSQWTTIMNTYCPGTCGTCLNGTGCRDLNIRCLDMRQLCEDVTFYGFMTANCARTCDRCTTTTTISTTFTPSSSTCLDVASNCAENSYLCNNSVYYSLMTRNCPNTCGRCSNSIISSSCSDTNSNCANWVRNGFCNNTYYTLAQRRQYCGRSCNLC